MSVERFWSIANAKNRLPIDEWPRLFPIADDYQRTQVSLHSRRVFVGTFAPDSKTRDTFKAQASKKHAGLPGAGWKAQLTASDSQ